MHRCTHPRLSRRRLLASVLSVPLAPYALAQSAEGPVVATTNGKVRGLVDQGIHVFRGLPYAAPTVGANRFLPPKPPSAWTGVREALLFGASSPQTNPAGSTMNWMMRAAVPSDPPGVSESESCLVLNVWTPAITGRRPVMVWLHGGGFSSGSASPPMYDGVALARRGDIVVVGVNHRLNVFGYTHLAASGGPAFSSSGNAGMLDIVAALEWVAANIAAFGGDPSNVTIFGESGGGAKVSILLAMPAARGLFHKAIIESGPGLRVGSAEEASKGAELLAAELGLRAQQVHELQQQPTERVLKAYFAVLPKLAGGGLGTGAFNPVLDGSAIPRHPFDPDAPAVSASVPILIGSNHNEAALFLRGSEQDFAIGESALKQRVSAAFPRADAQALIAAYRAGNPSATPWDLFVLMSTDRMFGANTILLAERKAAAGGAPVYVYRFDWETPGMGGHMHAAHGVEVPFVFDNTTRAAGILGAPSGGVEELAATISGAWIAFARSGVPAAPKLPPWPAYSASNRKVMLLNAESRLADDPGGAERRALLKAL